MSRAYLAFTEKGMALAHRLAGHCPAAFPAAARAASGWRSGLVCSLHKRTP